VTRDYVLVGGGLQNGLIALALRAHQPAASILMVERGEAPGGNHTWCFHAGDVAAEMAWLAPVVAVTWDGYDVSFPAYRRTLASPYSCVTSHRFADEVRAALARPGCELRTHTTAVSVGADHVLVRARDGAVSEIKARMVIDARGPDRADVQAGGWQKFLGQELELAAPHGLARPILMDATVEQRDGFRFMYVLPLAERRVLVEDTSFSDDSHLDVTALRASIGAYVAARGWSGEVVREETGVLPLPSKCAPAAAGAPLVAGYAGGWFHPVTGYSFRIAARLAQRIATGADLALHARAHTRHMAYALRLNKMLFGWFAPDQRYRVLERFYRLPEATVRRFYALELTPFDRARILVGRPPRGLSLAAMLGRAP
jgi:lycopene beta-cyclase